LKTGTQIFIDKALAKPLAYSLNFITRIAGQLLGIDHSLDKPFKTIAVCKFKGMGSIIQATPLLSALKRQYPDAELIFVSTQANKTLLQRIGAIDTVVCLDDKSAWRLIQSIIRSLIFLIKRRPEIYIDLEIYSDFSTIFTLLTLSKNRFGYYLRSSTYRLGIYTHMMFFNPRVPISEVYMQMARLLGYRDEKPGLDDLSQAKADPIINKPYILVNPNASDLRIERRWHKNNFAELIGILLEKYPGYTIVLIGSASEKAYTQSVASHISSPGLINLAGSTSLDQLIQLIRDTHMLITNDTGPMHIAFATQTPTVCLFGPCSPEQYGIHPNAYIIYNKVYCSPCVHDFEIPPCKGDNVCMQKITLSDVTSQVERIIAGQPPLTFTAGENIYHRDQKTLGIIVR
jgi:ADP-heptose:LPS heptosyltransferase